MIFVFNIFVLKTLNDTTLPLLLALFSVLIYLFLGFEKDNKKDFINNLMNILIFVFAYYIVTYLLGIFTGFLLNGYSLKFINIIRNLSPVIMFQVSKELLRYEINTKGERNKSILILSCIIFIMADLSSKLFLYDMSNPSDVFELIEIYLFPFISENILMTYLSVKAGYRINIIYQMLMKLPNFLIPIIPNFGEYFDIIIRLAFPCIVLYGLVKDSKKAKLKKFIKSRQDNTLARISFSITFALLIVVVYLTSGFFTYYALTIGSGSMEDTLDVGDVVIVKKTNDYENLKVGDILVYSKGEKIVVHRITNIINHYGTYIFKTQGDANNDEDPYNIWEDEVIGTVKVKIKFLGYPTIWLNELVN